MLVKLRLERSITMEGRRVITRFGFGEIIEEGQSKSSLKLDMPFLGEEIKSFDNRSEIFNFSDYAVLMVINTPQAMLSTAIYFPTQEKAKEIFNLHWPPDQCCYLLDFKNLTFELNFQPGLLINEGFNWQSAWLDRWGKNDIYNLSSTEEAGTFIESFRKTMLATSIGITISVLLAMENKKILSYIVMAETGIVLDRGFL